MESASAYLFRRFFYRIIEFLRHWYVESVRIYFNFVLNQLQAIDYSFAWKITLKNLFKPLYKDYSVIGYVLGFIFRVLRLFVSTIIYGFIFVFAAAVYVAWLALPVFLIFKVFFSK